MKKLIIKLTVALTALIGLFGLVSVSAKADQVKIGANAKNVKVKTFKYSESQSTTDSDKKDSDDSDKKSDKKKSDSDSDSDESEDTDSLTGDAKLDSDVETFILKQSKNGYELDNIIVKQNNDIMVIMHKAK